MAWDVSAVPTSESFETFFDLTGMPCLLSSKGKVKLEGVLQEEAVFYSSADGAGKVAGYSWQIQKLWLKAEPGPLGKSRVRRGGQQLAACDDFLTASCGTTDRGGQALQVQRRRL